MKIHHLYCGAFRSFGGNPLIGNAKPFKQAEGVVHCLLVETEDGLLLIDTGFGLGDFLHSSGSVHWMISLRSFSRDPAETSIRQIHLLGSNPYTDEFERYSSMELSTRISQQINLSRDGRR